MTKTPTTDHGRSSLPKLNLDTFNPIALYLRMITANLAGQTVSHQFCSFVVLIIFLILLFIIQIPTYPLGSPIPTFPF